VAGTPLSFGNGGVAFIAVTNAAAGGCESERVLPLMVCGYDDRGAGARIGRGKMEGSPSGIGED
jgi:hypothetical protein